MTTPTVHGITPDEEATVSAFLLAFARGGAARLGVFASVAIPQEATIISSRAATDWRLLVRVGKGEVRRHEQTIAEVRRICTTWARLLFAIPTATMYVVPDHWKTLPIGIIWWRAYLWTLEPQDVLVSISEAARLVGVSEGAIRQHLRAGKLTEYPNPDGHRRQRARLVHREEVMELYKKGE